MSQSHRASLVETVVSTAIGFAINVVIQWWLWQCYQIRLGTGINVLFTCVFTASSMLRTYLIRRLFNWIGRMRAITPGGGAV